MREMKDSRVKGIGEIPKKWKVQKLKYLVSYNDETLSESTPTDFAFDYIDIGSVKNNKVINLQRMDFADAPSRARRIVRPGDIIISTVRTYLKAVATINDFDIQQIASTGFIVLRAKENALLSQFLKYAVLAESFISTVEARSVGITYPAINTSDVVEIKISVPSIPEQQTIADFLDSKCSDIDALTSDIESQINMLEQYKRSVITEAVTKGLNPDAEMKDSGVEWFPDIPKLWSVGRIKDIIDVLTDYTANGSFGDLSKNVEYQDNEDFARLIRLTDLRDGLNNAGVYVDEHSYEYLSKSSLYGGEVLVANVGAYAGLFCEMPYVNMKATLGPNMFLIKTNRSMLQHYLYYLGNASIMWEQLQQKAISSAQPKLNKTDVKTVYIPIPSVSEQKEIADYLDDKCSDIDAIIADKQAQLDTLTEYKKSLIYEYVTGKKEVPTS